MESAAGFEKVSWYSSVKVDDSKLIVPGSLTNHLHFEKVPRFFFLALKMARCPALSDCAILRVILLQT